MFFKLNVFHVALGIGSGRHKWYSLIAFSILTFRFGSFLYLLTDGSKYVTIILGSLSPEYIERGPLPILCRGPKIDPVLSFDN